MNEALRDHLKDLASPILDKLEFQHWVSGDDADAGPSYCGPCVQQFVADNPGKDIMADGGWPQEDDSPRFCETCDCPLHYTLTDYGLVTELQHLEDSEIELNPLTAYELLAVFDSAQGTGYSDEIEALETRLLEMINQPRRPTHA